MKLRIVVFAATLLIVFAAPADAKGATTLQVTGDGIAGVIVIRPTDNPTRWSRLLDSSRFFETGLDPGIGGGVDGRAAVPSRVWSLGCASRGSSPTVFSSARPSISSRTCTH